MPPLIQLVADLGGFLVVFALQRGGELLAQLFRRGLAAGAPGRGLRRIIVLVVTLIVVAT